MIDPGGNWLRISKLGDTEEEAASEKVEGFARIIDVAARLGDAHGDQVLALKTLENGLARSPESHLRFLRVMHVAGVVHVT